MKIQPAIGTNNTRNTVTNTNSASLPEPFETLLFSGVNADKITVLGAETANNNVKLHVRSACGEYSLPLSAPPKNQTNLSVLLASIKAGDLVLLQQVRNGVKAATVSTLRPALRGGVCCQRVYPGPGGTWETEKEQKVRIWKELKDRLDKWAHEENGPLENLEIAANKILLCYDNRSEKLNLRGLQLKNLPADLKKLKSLRELDLSYNQINNIDALKKLTGLVDLNLSSNQINNVDVLGEMPSLKCLYLNDNQINNLDALRALPSLETLSLADNQINNIDALMELQNLRWLDLSYNQIDNIRALEKLTGLVDLNLSSNQINNLDALLRLTSLQDLDLSHNQINNFDEPMEMRSLKCLYLNDNQINNLDAFALDKLTSLQDLHLSSNQINNLDALRELPSLETLSLADNQINNIDALRGLQNLRWLDLSSNQINNINALREMPSLRGLDLSSNQIDNIRALRKLTGLVDLKLSSNPINNIDALRKLTSLRWLDLTSTQINHIDALTELPSSSFETLDLDKDQANKIYTTRVEGLKHLWNLDLDNDSEEMLQFRSRAERLTDLAFGKKNTSSEQSTSNVDLQYYVYMLTKGVRSPGTLLCVYSLLNVLAKCGKIDRIQNGGGNETANANAVNAMYRDAICNIANMAAEERQKAKTAIHSLILSSQISGLITDRHLNLLENKLKDPNS